MRSSIYLHYTLPIFCSLLLTTHCSAAQTNSWTKPASGNWEEPFWSLGILPAAAQSVEITNAGFKAVAIGPQTWRQFPDSLTVGNLHIDGPSNSLNTLLLNYAFTDVPLRVLGNLEIGTNGSLVNLYSALIMTNGSFLAVEGGSVQQEGGFVNVSDARLDGHYSALAADMRFDQMQIGVLASGSFDQTGGTNVLGSLTLSDYFQSNSFAPYEAGAPAAFNLTNGMVLANNVLIGFADAAQWNQSGGLVQAQLMQIGARLGNMAPGTGTYRQNSGEFHCDYLTLGFSGGSGTFIQRGGTNWVGGLEVGVGLTFNGGSWGSYTLSNAVLYSGSVRMGAGEASYFKQFGSTHYITNGLAVEGAYGPHSSHEVHPSEYFINGGTLDAGSLDFGFASLVQSNGTTHVRGSASFDGGDYLESLNYLTVQGGLFTCNDFSGNGCDVIISDASMIVTNLLSIRGQAYFCPCQPPAGYSRLIAGGSGALVASNIEIHTYLGLGSERTWRVTNSGYIKLADQSFLSMSIDAQERFGNLIVDGQPTIWLGSTNLLLFADSHGETWSRGSHLTITNWNGLTNGGGPTRVLFGNSSAGLTRSQLRMIQFADPAGFPAGIYDAVILNTGEIVPTIPPIMNMTASSTNVILWWNGNLTLQTATNVEGPFVDLQNTSNPFTNQYGTFPRQFFRLKR